jgi:hypothetical protein
LEVVKEPELVEGIQGELGTLRVVVRSRRTPM